MSVNRKITGLTFAGPRQGQISALLNGIQLFSDIISLKAWGYDVISGLATGCNTFLHISEGMIIMWKCEVHIAEKLGFSVAELLSQIVAPTTDFTLCYFSRSIKPEFSIAQMEIVINLG